MTSQAITTKSIGKCIYDCDIYKHNHLLSSSKKNETINLAFQKAQADQPSFPIKKIKRNGKDCYNVTGFENVLLSRNLANNVRAVLPKSKSRNQISRQLVQHLKEGTSYRIYRLDIKSFFESVSHATIEKSLESNLISSQTKLLIMSILENSNFINQCGLPRGLEFSPPLAELILGDFDSTLIKSEDVFYYCRYVDDIIIVTTGFESSKNFLKYIKSLLPKELSLNYNKQKIIHVDKRQSSALTVASFDYLGYLYTVRDTDIPGKTKSARFREVDVSLSSSRVKRIKTRLSRALYCYSKDGDFELLKNRIIFLTSNRIMKDKKSSRVIATGVYYNNVNITDNGQSLQELDIFFKKRVLGFSSNRWSGFTNILTIQQKRHLLSYSFVNGYKNNNYKRFPPNKLGEIKNAWRF
ncbi:antiviral reverse transcriptase Drt3a [Vibrio parahaemolyticus]|uniref:antiviral reverse transcriptase Drt3a n=1 Tax=Vibrio parahaemolyticus TaxID=670 RepID=UPI001BAEB1D4|nr:antiviral reverse transcriptase Drt3a [Vibrio parahaemolyticus]QUD93069.1 RNA-directed DNA polymerase [Vibrio parahaemolyticus]